MATHSSILACKIPWTEEPGGQQSMESQESDTTKQLNHHHCLCRRRFKKRGESSIQGHWSGLTHCTGTSYLDWDWAQALPHLRPSVEPWCGCTPMHTWMELIEGPGSDMPTGRGTLSPLLCWTGHTPWQCRRSTAMLFTGHEENAEKLSGPSGWKTFYATLPRHHCRECTEIRFGTERMPCLQKFLRSS